MSGIAPVGAAATAPTDATTSSDDGELADAFSQGLVQFMGTMLQSSESDVTDAINDTTSDPDAPD